MVTSLHRPQYEVFRKMMVEARETAGLTQVQVANALGRPQSFVSKYEGGDRRLDFTEFVEIAGILEINVAAFITAYQDSIKDRNLCQWLR